MDLCCGIGAFTHLLDRLGLSLVCGVDQNPRWEALFQSLHPGAKFVHGDINEAKTIRALVDLGCFHGIMCAGISCNAHSTMGDRRGMADPRSLSLPKALQTCFMLQAACFVLECTPAIMQDKEAQAIMKQFAQATGYRWSQTLVQLARSWCARRERWFGLFCAPLLGVFNLQNLPELVICPTVHDLMTEVKLWPQFEQAQLTLNLYELSKYHAYTKGGIQCAYLNRDGKLPTLLHSAGNALYTCACGCRAALSEARLKERGLVGVLVPLGTSQVHMNIDMEHCRYLHPIEMWCLMGGLPEVSFGHNLRLAMSGIGQCVAPLVGFWVFAQIRQHVDGFLDLPVKLCPHDVLHAYAQEVKQKCLALWPAPIPPTVVEDPIEDCSDMIEVHIQWPLQSGEAVTIKCPHGTTGAHMVAAETALGSLDFEHTVSLDGMPVDLSLPLPADAFVSIVPRGWSCRREGKESVPCCLDLPEHDSTEVSPPVSVLRYDVPVTTHEQLSQLRVCDQPRAERIAILAQQGPIWSDDELLFWLETTAAATEASQKAQVWDPLLISGLTVQEDFATWKRLATTVGPEATVVSAVAIDRHWYPVVWRVDPIGSKMFTCAVSAEHVAAFQSLADVLGRAQGSSGGDWTSKDRGFVITRHCGAMVVAFVRHLLVEARLPVSASEVEVLAGELRVGFERCLPEFCYRPRLAGLGLLDHQALHDLLLSHGVVAGEAKSRAQALVAALGDQEVARDLQCSNPWREMKWLANQQSPPFLIVKPSELQAQVQRRQGQGTVGNKKHKSQKGKGKGKQNPALPMLDPTRLRVEHGLLYSETGLPLSQVPLPQVGPNVSGVVLTTMALAAPYVQSGKVVSSGALAFFVVDSLQVVPGLPSSVERLPLVCAENSEPLLVDGLLIQLGVSRVQRPSVGEGCQAVNSVATCVIKAMVFRDSVTVPWEKVVAHPMQYIIQQLCPLQICEDVECPGCEAWHRTDQYPVDSPLIEVWGRQWMTHSFAYCNPEDSDLFAVHMRLPESLQISVQEFSGEAGVFVEPKSLCGRKPSNVFQVIWTPKSDLRQLLMQRQTLPEVCGVARLGSKLGLRCKVEFAASLSAKIRPEQVFLPQGDKLTFLVGPMPYGTLRSSLTKAMSEFGWTVRPLQPVSTRSSVPGLMFRVQAITEPPKKVMRMSHGDVVVTRESEHMQSTPAKPGVVATPATVSKVSTEATVDDLQVNDPWAPAASKQARQAPQVVHMGSPLEDMEQRVISAVLAQMPKNAMEVDNDESVGTRVDQLEMKVQELQHQSHALQSTVNQHAAEQEHQFSEIRTQIHQQGSHFEQALASHSGQLQTFQDSFQEQFRQQTAHQQSMLDSMFQQQMCQFESLLAKRHRPE